MKILLVHPERADAHTGNLTTALRWERILAGLGHDVRRLPEWDGEEADLLVTLHAAKSADSVLRFRALRPDRPVIVGLTGTDVYRDMPQDRRAQEAVSAATRLVALQPLAADELPEGGRDKLRVIFQSAKPVADAPAPRRDRFEVAVLAHLRPVKDPLLAAAAARLLAPSSRVQVRHAGAALDPELGRSAERETEANPRYRWLGAVSPEDARRLLAASRLLVVTSRLEGGANVVSEALAAGVPVLSTRIPGSVGILGPDYPGYFPVGDARALAELLTRVEARAESRDGLYAELRRRVASLRPLVDPAREREAWRELLAELAT